MRPSREPGPARREMPARWQSGHAEDCKSSYVGSIPARASNSFNDINYTYKGSEMARAQYGTNVAEVIV